MAQRVGERARELEVRLARLRVLTGELLSLDAYERWGPRDDALQAAAMADAARADAERRALEAELERLVPEVRACEPEAVVAWARAHKALLDAFVAALPEGERERVSRFVAQQERARWEEVERGERAFVDQNIFYIHYDPALVTAYFGELG